MSEGIKFVIKDGGANRLNEASNMGAEINSLEEGLMNVEKNWELAYYYAKEYEEKVEKAKIENKKTLNELKIKLHEIKEKLKEFGEKSKELRKKIKEIKEKQTTLLKESETEETSKIN